MSAKERLEELGFEVDLTSPQPGGSPKTAVRIRTSLGWVYGKFDAADLDGIEAWASRYTPE